MLNFRLILGSLIFISTTLVAQDSKDGALLRTPTKKSTTLNVTGEQLQDASAGQIPFQGRLTDGGSPVTGTREFVFTIQIDQSTTWTETHPTVQVTNGFYSIVLGSITPLPANLFAASPSKDVTISVDGQVLSPVKIYAPFGSVNGEDVTFNGPNDSINVFLGATAGGYNGSLELGDSLGYSSFFVNAENDGAYMQFSTQDASGNFQNALVAQSFENRSNLSLYGQNFDQTSVQRMINHYVTNTEIGLGGDPYTDTYIRSGSDWFDNQGTLLAAIGNARDPNNGDPNGKSGFMSLWGTNTFNIELTGKRWQNDDLPILQMFGSNDDGAGWWLSNFTVEVDTSAGNESFASIYMNNTVSGGTSNETVLISSNLFGSQSGGAVFRDPGGQDKIIIDGVSAQVNLNDGGAVRTSGPDTEINAWLGFNWLNGGTDINNRGALILFGDTTTRDALGGIDIRRASLTVADDGFGRDVGNLLLHAPVTGDNELVDLGVNTDGTIYKGRLILKGSDGSFFEITSDGLGSAPQTSYALDEFVGELISSNDGNGLYGQLNFSGTFDGTVLNSGGASIGTKGFDATNPNNGYLHVNDTVGTAAKLEALSQAGENFGIMEVRSTLGARLDADPRGLRIYNDAGELKTDLNIFQTNDAGSLVLYGNNNNRNMILGATGATGGETGFIGLYDTNDQNKVSIRVDTVVGGGQDYGRVSLWNTDFSREITLKADESRLFLSSGNFAEQMNITDVGISGGANSFTRGFNLNMDQAGGALLEMFNGGNLNVFIQGDNGNAEFAGLLKVGSQVNSSGLNVFGGGSRVNIWNSTDSTYQVVEAFEELDYGIIDLRDATGAVNMSLHGGNGTLLLGQNAFSDGIRVNAGIPGINLASGGFDRISLTANTGTGLFNDASGSTRIELLGQTGEIFADSITAILVTQTSDERFKERITPVEDALYNVNKLQGVSYFWNDDAKNAKGFKNKAKQIGLVAQEVEEIYPEFVHTDNDGYKSVNYSQMVAVLIEAIKELDQKVADLESENKELKAELAKSSSKEIEELRAEIESIKAIISSSQNIGK